MSVPPGDAGLQFSGLLTAGQFHLIMAPWAINSAARVLPSHGRSQRFKSSIAHFLIMKPSLFRPRQFATPPSLVLVPYFPQDSLFAALQKQALRQQNFLHSSLLWFENMTVICGFIGYPHLLTLLQMIAGLADKEIYFLGSAGAIARRFKEPAALQVSKIYSSSILKRFSRKSSFPLKVFPDGSFPSVPGVSVDIIQRETPSWLAEQRLGKIAIVEMELFTLRWFLQKSFHALVVLSDQVEPSGIRPFAEKQKFQREFERAFNYIIKHINCG